MSNNSRLIGESGFDQETFPKVTDSPTQNQFRSQHDSNFSAHSPVHEQKLDRILIMDDEESIREVAGAIFMFMGFEVDFAFNGTELLRKVRHSAETGNTFSMIIMDLSIPGGMGGKETIQQLREINRSVVAIVSSGYSDDPIMENPANYGFTDKLEKPFRKADLEKLVKKYIRT